MKYCIPLVFLQYSLKVASVFPKNYAMRVDVDETCVLIFFKAQMLCPTHVLYILEHVSQLGMDILRLTCHTSPSLMRILIPRNTVAVFIDTEKDLNSHVLNT